jgi:sugar phosphate isomerase/epimerase
MQATGPGMLFTDVFPGKKSMVAPQKKVSSFSPLQTVCRNRFPFTIACPSFIYRAGYVDNVRHLAPFLDEIQLLFFESDPPSLPSEALIRELADLSVSKNISYNVHLPTDVYLGHANPEKRRHAVHTLRTVMARCQALSPSTFTLHLERNPAGEEELPVARWQQNLMDSLQAMLPRTMDPRSISVENLDDPFDWVAPVIEAADLSVCMDMGHLMVQGVDLQSFYEKWQDRISTIHLHGVDGSKDHLPLDRLCDDRMKAVLQLLRRFSGVVVVENYSQPALNASLACLAKC